MRQLLKYIVISAALLMGLYGHAKPLCSSVHLVRSSSFDDLKRQVEVWSQYELNVVANPRVVDQLVETAIQKQISMSEIKHKFEILILNVKGYQNSAGVPRRLFVPHRIHFRLLQHHMSSGRLLADYFDLYNKQLKIATEQEPDLFLAKSPFDIALEKTLSIMAEDF